MRVPDAICKVVPVIDGDTVVVRLGGRDVTVRMIGVDAPETVHPTKASGRFGKESTAFVVTLLGGRSVRIEDENTGYPRTDRYGRRLAYLYCDPDGLFVNREIIARGFAHVETQYPFRNMTDFRAAQAAAREAKIGLWATVP